MPRKLRVQYPGAIYHLMNRGDRREKIFHDDEDRHRLLITLAEARDKVGWLSPNDKRQDATPMDSLHD
jgi:putative transposase